MPGVANSTNRTVRSLDEVWELGLILAEIDKRTNASIMNAALAKANEERLADLTPAKRRAVRRALDARLGELREKDPVGRYAREAKRKGEAA